METSTKQFRKRNAILACLRRTDRHPSAEAVYAQLKQEYSDLSLGTVYRNLSLFKEQGLITSLGAVNGVERFDGNVAPHVHFVCSSCDAIVDLPGLTVPETLSSAAASQVSGKVEACHLLFSGLCRDCLKHK